MEEAASTTSATLAKVAGEQCGVVHRMDPISLGITLLRRVRRRRQWGGAVVPWPPRVVQSWVVGSVHLATTIFMAAIDEVFPATAIIPIYHHPDPSSRLYHPHDDQVLFSQSVSMGLVVPS